MYIQLGKMRDSMGLLECAHSRAESIIGEIFSDKVSCAPVEVVRINVCNYHMRTIQTGAHGSHAYRVDRCAWKLVRTTRGGARSARRAGVPHARRGDCAQRDCRIKRIGYKHDQIEPQQPREMMYFALILEFSSF